MSTKLFLFLIAVALAESTQITFMSYCPFKLVIADTTAVNGDYYTSFICNLPTGFACKKNYSDIPWLWVHEGYILDDNYADFQFNPSGNDSYFLNTNKTSFKYPLQIQSIQPGSTVLTCRDVDCPDSYDNTYKYGTVRSGDNFVVTWCPFNDQNRMKEELPMIETVEIPIYDHSKHLTRGQRNPL